MVSLWGWKVTLVAFLSELIEYFPVHFSASFSRSSQRECILSWPDCMLPSSLQRSSSITIQVVLFLGPNSVFKLRGTFNVSLLFQGKRKQWKCIQGCYNPKWPCKYKLKVQMQSLAPRPMSVGRPVHNTYRFSLYLCLSRNINYYLSMKCERESGQRIIIKCWLYILRKCSPPFTLG